MSEQQYFMKDIKTKKCSVVLERLDEKLLKQCLRKYGLKLSSFNSTSHPKDNHQNHLNGHEFPDRFRKHLRVYSKSNMKYDFKQRRKKSKPLRYTGNENSSDNINLKKRDPETEACTKSQLGLDDNFFLESVTSAKTEEVSFKKNFTATDEANNAVQTLPIFEAQKCKIETTFTNKLFEKSRTKNQQVSRFIDREIEIIKEVAKTKSKNFDKSETAVPKLTVSGNDEDDSREDEDDKNTVIFEEEGSEDTEFKIFEFRERIVGNIAGKEFKNKEIINQKKRRLVKFKKKTVKEKNIGNIKLKNKSIEGCSTWQETLAGVSEKVCHLVKRLLEMHRSISKLQQEWQKNSHSAVHFHRMLNTQREKFLREIRKSRNTILKCFNIFGDARKMVLDISKQIGSNTEDVASVISHCVQFEELCEVDKNRSAVEKMVRQIVSQSSINLNKMITENFERFLTRNDPQQAINIFGSLSPSGIVNYHPEIYLTGTQTNGNYHQMSKNQKPWVNQDHTVVAHPQKLIRIEQVTQGRPITTIVRHHLPHKSTRQQQPNATQYCKVGFAFPRAIPPPLGYDPVFVQKSTVFLPSASGNALSIVLSTNQSSATRNDVSVQGSESDKNHNFFTKVSNNILNSFSPIKMVDRKVPNPNNLITLSESQSAFLTPSTNPFKLPDQKRFQSHEKLSAKIRGTEMNLKTESINSSNRVLDPTIPQKLTMKNCRLQAGPVLEPRVEGTNPSRPLAREKNFGLAEEDSRMYVCAQNSCENPGVGMCKGCRSVIYCSETCQLKHWNLKHKMECHQLKELRG